MARAKVKKRVDQGNQLMFFLEPKIHREFKKLCVENQTCMSIVMRRVVMQMLKTSSVVV